MRARFLLAFLLIPVLTSCQLNSSSLAASQSFVTRVDAEVNADHFIRMDDGQISILYLADGPLTDDVRTWERKRLNSDGNVQALLMQEIFSLEEPERIKVSLDWLRDTVLKAEETRFFYPSMYAKQLHRTGYLANTGGVKETALAMAYYSSLLLLTDAARCDDKDAGSSYYNGLLHGLDNVWAGTDDLSEQEIASALETALMLEERRKDRVKRPQICRTGANYTVRALEAGGDTMKETIAEEGNDYGVPPGSKIVIVQEAEGVEIFYHSDEVWHQKREEIRQKFKSSLGF